MVTSAATNGEESDPVSQALFEEEPRRISRRELARTLLSGIATGAFFPGLSPAHPLCELLRKAAQLDPVDAALGSVASKPLFLSGADLASLDRIAEAIVPGSHKAGSAAFIDLLLSVDSQKCQGAFLDSVAAFEAASKQTFGQGIVALSQTQLNTLLEAASTGGSANYAHFANLKGWAVGAYYSSEIGMRELGWTPDRVFPAFPACTRYGDHS